MEEKNKKVKQAIALEYNPSEDAPKVIASGRGVLAEKIIEKAKESEVPIHRDDKLADTLSRLEMFPLSGHIPQDKELRNGGYHYVIAGKYICVYRLIAETV